MAANQSGAARRRNETLNAEPIPIALAGFRVHAKTRVPGMTRVEISR
jgi:hypothetical protein